MAAEWTRSSEPRSSKALGANDGSTNWLGAVAVCLWIIVLVVLDQLPDEVDDGCDRVGLCNPAQRLGGRSPPARVFVGMRAREDRADSVHLEKFDGRIYAVTLSQQADIHKRESWRAGSGEG